MVVYRAQRRSVTPVEEVHLSGQSRSALDRLIYLGQLESALVDALSPEWDAPHPVAHALRAATLAAARQWRGGTAEVDFAALAALPLPPSAEMTVPEGYAWYALYPETYALAAERFHAAVRPARVAVIGIRSIGASLSAVVAARLEELGCEVHSWTVRPRGHPFDRRLALAPALERELFSFAEAHFVVVDEGPGLSGSSFASVAQALSALGIPDERIAFFPSWQGDPAGFRSETARRRWPRHRKYLASFEEVFPVDGLVDLSGGAWRIRFLGPDESRWPPVQPQHERRKYLDGSRLWKFAGLGRFGAPKLPRAERLHEAGFGPRPLGLRNGFLETEVVEGRPSIGAAPPIGTLARYLCFLRDAFPAPRGASFEELAEMIEVNSGGRISRSALLPFRGPVEDAPAAAIDGRLAAHEWVATPDGWRKTDALDHHDDHFLPGCQPIAWDVAGAAVELGLEPAAEAYLAQRCGSEPALPFYRLAYLAFRLGYVTLAAEALSGSPDAARFARARDRLLRRLQAAAV